jgi:hypothetical protein
MALILSGTDGVSDVDGTAATPAVRGADTNTGIFFPAADTIAFAEGGVEAMRLNSNGALVLQGGDTAANGVGITFPATQSASSNANTLDDYEEGTWTPTLTNGTSTATSVGNYRKIGGLVFISCEFYNVNISGWATTALSVTGMPFVSSINHMTILPANIPNGSTALAPLIVRIINNSSTIFLGYRGGSVNWADLIRSDITNNTSFSLYINGCFTTA